MKYEVKVQLKPDVLNTEAKEILHALHSQGYSNVSSLQTAKSFVLEMPEGTSIDVATKIAKNILANEVIEDFTVVKV